MLSKELRLIAKKVVNDSLRIKHGDSVLISGSNNSVVFMNMLAIECYMVGAQPLMWLHMTNDALEKVLTQATIDRLNVTPKHLMTMIDVLDAHIRITTPHERKFWKKVDNEVLKAFQEPFGQIFDKIAKRKVKFCWVTVPLTKDPELNDALREALKADCNYMAKIGKRLQKELSGDKVVHVTDSLGTNLTFRIGNIVYVSDGILDEEDLKHDFQVYMPDGVVETFPKEETANGKVVIKEAYDQSGRYKGIIKNLQLVFDEGKIVDSSADSGYNIFRKRLDESSGDKDMFAEFGIGINPEVQKILGIIQVDEMMHGCVHIAIGDNYGVYGPIGGGGKNVSDLHWDFIIQKPSVKIDNKQIIHEGNFVNF